ncbi:MAG: hypothetical protein DWQ05_02745 [Calditrichaeota bacterium]|nr:MAG: hypothetical protein DWQ05_02745 [Calditrichota bacterium]
MKLSFVAFRLVFAVFIFHSCSQNEQTYQFATGPKTTSYYNIGEVIAEAVEKENGIHLKIMSRDSANSELNAVRNLQLLNERQADFIITQNDVALKSENEAGESLIENGIRSILPLYPQVFMIIHNKSLQPTSLADLIVGRKIGLGPETSGTTKFARAFFNEFGIDNSMYTARFRSFEKNILSDSIDVVCLLTGFNNNRIKNLLKNGGVIFSFGDPELAGSGSAMDGFCLNYPLARPYVLPRHTYEKLPPKPVLTVAVDAVLLTHSGIDDDVVYKIIKTIIEYKQHMASSHDNELISQFSEQFLASNLRFPLHPGAKQYLERNKPTFIERWAETITLIFSVLIALIGAGSTLFTWRRQRRKNRIDKYYERVLRTEKQIPHFDTHQKCTIAIDDLKSLREEAFRQLIKEKLMANESFRIFIQLLNDTIDEIRRRQSEL